MYFLTFTISNASNIRTAINKLLILYTLGAKLGYQLA